ncbi:hypothetical protein [Nonomuraea sp. SYSU D8015]|uniref:hypothetical protein n=1 Tax=Nonomuraea sp. SYSU D8015 TaxID=2593644 RepID=UPI001660CAF4|nr:hypothetical protein [Nonomuraea sp. SYSU D8015]
MTEPADELDDETEDAWEIVPPTSVIGPHGPQVLREQCTTCIFHPGNRMDLRSGRLKDLVEQTLNVGGWITCHDTLLHGRFGHHFATRMFGAMCKGFVDKYGDRSHGVRMLRELMGLVQVDRPEDYLSEND